VAYDQSVRQLMNNAGYNNDDIGYDTNSGYVTYKGSNFMKPQINQGGTTFTDTDSFNQANQAYQSTQKQQNPNANYSWWNSAEDQMSVPDRYAYYISNPDKGQAELQRANTKLGYLQSIGDQQGVASANQYMQGLKTALGNMGVQQNPYDKQVVDLITQVQKQLANSQPYDVYNSPEYAAAQQQAQYGAQKAINSGLEALGTSGMARSSDAISFARNAQDEAQQRLLTQIVPQLVQQHQAQQQQGISNLMALINPMMNQQGVYDTRQQHTLDNAYRDKTFDYGAQQDTIKNNQWQESFDYQKMNDQQKMEYQQARDAIVDEKDKRNFDEDVRRYGLDYALKERQTNANIANMGADNARANAAQAMAAGNQQLANLYQIWDRTGRAPAGIPGVAEGTPLAAKPTNTTATAEKNDLTSTYLTNIDKMTPESRAAFFKAEKSAITKDLGLSGYNQLYDFYFDKYGDPK